MDMGPGSHPCSQAPAEGCEPLATRAPFKSPRADQTWAPRRLPSAQAPIHYSQVSLAETAEVKEGDRPSGPPFQLSESWPEMYKTPYDKNMEGRPNPAVRWYRAKFRQVPAEVLASLASPPALCWS